MSESPIASKTPLTDPHTGRELEPKEQPGYYPGYRTLSQQKFWDEATRTVINRRLQEIPPIRFFTPTEERTMRALADRIIPQDDRTEASRIPIVEWIDERLFTRRIDGFRFEDMPPDFEAYRMGLHAIDESARELHGEVFARLGHREQEEILKTLHHGECPAARDAWGKLPIERFWHLLVQDCVTVYYAHPWAWDEIGYGGPAYPRAYTRLEGGLPEPWEVNEQRYQWNAPADSISDVYEPLPSEHHGVSGQGGTH